MMGRRTRLVAAGLVLAWGVVRPLAAQIDYRNLDDGRPNRVADAYPIERYAFELALQVSRHSFAPHLEFGAGRNLMIGLGIEASRTSGGGVDVGGLEAGLLWNFRRETVGLPALSVSAAFGIERFGDPGAATVGLLATRSFGRYRLHLNAAGRVTGAGSPAGEPAPKWWAGLALDRTLIRSSTLLVADLTAERRNGIDRAVWRAGLGVRRQILPTWVLHGGLRQAFGDYRSTELNFGLSHSFGLAGLMRGGSR